MSTRHARILAFVTALLAFGTLTCAMAMGGNILMIILGLIVAATSMRLFQYANPESEDE